MMRASRLSVNPGSTTPFRAAPQIPALRGAVNPRSRKDLSE